MMVVEGGMYNPSSSYPGSNAGGAHGELENSAVDAMLKLSESYQQQQQQRDTSHYQIDTEDERCRSLSFSESSSDDRRSRTASFGSKDRAERAFVPDNKKDEYYWSKRKKNNEAAKRSREKRKMMDVATSEKVQHLTNINNELSEELRAIKEYYRLPLDKPFSPSSLPLSKPMQEKPYYSPMKPTAPPAIPLEAMASFLQQQQQLVSQAAMAHLQMPPVDIKPILTESHELRGAREVSSSSIQLPPVSNFTSAPLTNHTHARHSTEQQHCYKNQSIVCKKPRIDQSYTDISDDEDGGAKPWDTGLPTDQDSSQGQQACTSSSSSSSGDTPSMEPETNTYNYRSNQKGIPFKLRHKHMSFSQIMKSLDTQQETKYDGSGESATSSDNVPAVLQEVDSYSDDSSYVDDSDGLCRTENTSYCDRRRRNNLAARKCRENKKLLLQMKEAQSEYLELENRKLKDDLQTLTHEVQSLKNLMLEKQRAEQQGQRYIPPPIELLHKILHKQ